MFDRCVQSLLLAKVTCDGAVRGSDDRSLCCMDLILRIGGMSMSSMGDAPWLHMQSTCDFHGDHVITAGHFAAGVLIDALDCCGTT